MTDLFAQQGITFETSGYASTAPQATPEPIMAPKIDMGNAPANQTIPAVSSSSLTAPIQNNGPVPSPPDPQQISASLAGAGNGGTAAAGAAPPQPPANQNAPVDLFEQQGIKPPSVTEINTNAFNNGVPLNPTPPVDGLKALASEKGITIGSGSGPSSDAPTPEQAQERATAYAQNEQAQNLELAKPRFTPQQIQSWQNSPIPFSEAFQHLSASQVVPGGGFVQGYDALRLNNIAGKLKAGQEITPDEQGTLNTFIDKQLEMNIRGFTWGGKLAYIGSQIPAFAIEFALSDGVGKMAQTGALKATEEIGMNAALSTVTGAATRVATTAALMPAQYVAKYGERRLNDSMAVTDKGQLILQDSQESPATSALLAFGHTSADVAGQLTAPLFGKFAVQPAMRVLATPLTAAAKNLSPEVTDALYQAWKAVQPGATVSKMFTNMGWAGMVEQLGANRVQQILNSSLDYASSDKESFDTYLKSLTPDKDQLLLEGGLISIAGGIHVSTGLVSHFMQAKGVPEAQAQETAANMSALEKDQFVNQNMPLPKSDVPHFQEPTPAQKNIDQTAPASPEVMHMDEMLQQAAPSARIVQGQTAAVNAANPPLVNANQSFFNKAWSHWKDNVWPSLYAENINDVQPIENLSKEAIGKGAVIPEGQQSALTTSFTKSTPEWIRRNWTTDTTSWDSDGNQVTTGKGLKPIYDDFDNLARGVEPDMAARHQDLEDFLQARTLLEDHAKGLSDVTPDQLKKAGDDMTDLATKYGQNFKWFDTLGNELRDWDNRILHNLVSSGIKTQDWYDDTTSQRLHYSPLNRVVAEEYDPSISGGGLGKDVAPSNIGSLKQRKGSSLEIKNTFESRMRNSAVIMQRAALNKLRADIAKFADYYPDKIKVQAPAVLREAVEHSYDPKLRTKLEQLTEFLGGEVKRVDKIAGTKRGTLGAYEPATKNIFLRPGTTEGTLTHEAGHMLDYILNLKQRLLSNPDIKTELQNLAEDRLRSEIKLQQGAGGKTEFAEQFDRSPKSYVNYVKNDDEVLANFFDAWVNSPEQVDKAAPKAKAAFEKLIDDNPQLELLRDIRPSTSRAMETLQRQMLDMRGPKGSLPVYLNGRRMYMEMSPEIEKAFQNIGPIQMGMTERFLGGALRGAKKTLQEGATSTPDFMLRHFYRAIITSFINTKGAKITDFPAHLIGVAKGVFAAIGKNELYREWASSSGALNTFMDLSDKAIAKTADGMFNKGDISKFINPLKWREVAKNISDQSVRIALYEQRIKAGDSQLSAGLQSLDATGNYIRHGSFAKRINQYAPFFNDMVQSGDRFIRSHARDPVGVALRAMATITMPQMVLTGYYLFAADDKTRQEYLNLPDWRRALSMSVKIGNTWIPLPRSFAWGYAYGALPEKIMIWMYGGQHAPQLKDFWLRMLQETATSVSPVFDWTRAINPIFKSVLEDVTNYSFFRHAPVFTGDLNRTAPQNQFSDYTSETSKLLGKMFNFSPAQLDNTIYNMSGNTGKYALQFSDYVINKERQMAGQPVNQKPERSTSNPLYGGLLEETPRGTGTQAYQEFREHLNESSQANNEFKEATGKEKAEVQQQNARTLGAYPPINAVNSEVNKIQHQIRLINQNTNLSGYDKEAQINRLKDQETALIEGANQRYRSATGGKK